MKITWLENCDIKPEIRESIYSDLEKVASGAQDITLGKAFKDFIASIIPMAGMAAAGVAVSNVMNERAHNKQMDKAKESILQTKKDISNKYQAEDRAKAMARFDEVAQIAPSVCLNPALAARLVQDNLHSGLSSATVNQLATLQAQMMPNILQTQTLMKTSSEHVNPEFLGSVVADIYMVKEAKGRILSGDWLDRATTLGTIAAIPTIVGGIGGIANMVANKIKQIGVEKSLKQSYSEALEGDSDNAKILKENPEAATNAFKTLTHFAPSVALDSNAARGFMAKMVAYGQGGSDISDLKALSEVQKNMVAYKPANPFSTGFQGTPAAMKSMIDIGAHPLLTEEA